MQASNCPFCGAPYWGNASFCANCGKPSINAPANDEQSGKPRVSVVASGGSNQSRARDIRNLLVLTGLLVGLLLLLFLARSSKRDSSPVGSTETTNASPRNTDSSSDVQVPQQSPSDATREPETLDMTKPIVTKPLMAIVCPAGVSKEMYMAAYIDLSPSFFKDAGEYGCFRLQSTLPVMNLTPMGDDIFMADIRGLNGWRRLWISGIGLMNEEEHTAPPIPPDNAFGWPLDGLPYEIANALRSPYLKQPEPGAQWEVELNASGKKQIMYTVGRDECGAGRCEWNIFDPETRRVLIVGLGDAAHKLQTTSNGYYDLLMEGNYVLILYQFDGLRYVDRQCYSRVELGKPASLARCRT